MPTTNEESNAVNSGENTANTDAKNAKEPVRYLKMDEDRPPEKGNALCFSGGGYRAMLFHAGVLWRLNEIGWLPKLSRISSVSGGSITAGVLAMNWNELNFKNNIAENFEDLIINPVKNLASRTIDVSAVAIGSMWFGSIGDKVADAYRKYLYGDTTLQDIADEVSGKSPRFIFNATNVQSGVLWRFSKNYMGDYRVGLVENPEIDLAVAIAASSAFPPLLSPVELDLDPEQFTPGSGTDLQRGEFRTQIVLTDGGAYDNLGLETAWKRYDTILISDAGGGFEPEADPHRDWILHSVRVLFTIDNQVRSLRKRQAIEAFRADPPIKKGTYWGIRSDMAKDKKTKMLLDCPFDKTKLLAEESTRLKKLDRETQERLINWGYAISDLRMRQYVDDAIAAAETFPFPAVGVG